MKPETMLNNPADYLKAHLAADLTGNDPGTTAIMSLAGLISARYIDGRKADRKVISAALRQAIKQLETDTPARKPCFMIPKHLRTGDIDAWTAFYGRPLQMGQWVKVNENNEYSADWPGAYMVTGLALDTNTGTLNITLNDGEGAHCDGWGIHDLIEARHG